MSKFLPILLTVFLLTACAPTSVEPNEEIASENQTTDNFERNLKCLKLREDVEGRIGQNQIEYYNALGEEASLEQIFYSPKIGSCLYVVDNSGGGEDFWMTRKRLFDVLDDGPSSHPLESCVEGNYFGTDEEYSKTFNPQGCSGFQEIVDEYQN